MPQVLNNICRITFIELRGTHDEYYIILICFIILPVFLVIFIAIIETIRYEKHIDGFIMFTLGGLTNTTHLILEHYY